MFWLQNIEVLPWLQDIQVLRERCRDKALSVRKQALTSLTEVLLQFKNNLAVQK